MMPSDEARCPMTRSTKAVAQRAHLGDDDDRSKCGGLQEPTSFNRKKIDGREEVWRSRKCNVTRKSIKKTEL
jgi:hypothetical protein